MSDHFKKSLLWKIRQPKSSCPINIGRLGSEAKPVATMSFLAVICLLSPAVVLVVLIVQLPVSAFSSAVFRASVELDARVYIAVLPVRGQVFIDDGARNTFAGQNTKSGGIHMKVTILIVSKHTG